MSDPLPGILAPMTVPLAWAWGALNAARNRRYDRGTGIVRLPVSVVSVGNISVGGTGKTPFTAWLADRLTAAGRRPVIALRGYGAGRTGASDEAAEHADRLPGVDVVVDPDRAAALGAYLPAHPAVDVVLLDDGFQHRRVHRDLDIVLLPADADPFVDRLLPRGRLREPVTALRRAGAVVVTRASAVDDALARKIEAAHGRPPIAWARHAWTGLVVREGDAPPRREPVGWLAGRRVVTLLGIGEPGPVRARLGEAGATIVADVPARDHERFGPAKLERVRALAGGADAIVMTAKDWVRVRDRVDWASPIVVPALAIEVFAGEAALMGAVERSIRREP